MKNDAHDNDQDNWPLTPRTLIVLISALDELIEGLRLDIAELECVPRTDVGSLSTFADFPRATWGQSSEWWIEVTKSAQRVRDRLQADGWHTPRTPSEEAVVYVACNKGWIDIAKELHPALEEQIASLPDCGAMDYEWSEVLSALAGDEDVASMWMPIRDGIEDPADEANRELLIGDYRPKSWHRIFPSMIKT